MIFRRRNVPEHERDALERAIPHDEPLAFIDGRRPRAVHRADLHLPHRLGARAEQDIRRPCREDAGGSAAEFEAVAAVRKAIPRHLAFPRYEPARDERAPHISVAVQPPRAQDRRDREQPRSPEHETQGSALDKVPVPLRVLDPEEGICRGQKPAEREGEEEEGDLGDNVRLGGFPPERENGQESTAEQFRAVRRPNGKGQEREHDGFRGAHPRRKDEKERSHPRAGAEQGEDEEKRIEYEVFRKCVLPIDDHVPHPAEGIIAALSTRNIAVSAEWGRNNVLSRTKKNGKNQCLDVHIPLALPFFR